MKVYIETSSILYLIADADPYKKDRTVEMFEQMAVAGAQLFISQVVKAELSKAPPVLGKCIQAIMQNKKIADAPLTDEQAKLSELLLARSILPPHCVFESLHLAAAMSLCCDLLVSWDFEHLFTAKTLHALRGLASEPGLCIPDIGNPEIFLKPGFGSPRTLQELTGMRSQLIEPGGDAKKAIEQIRKLL